MTREVDVAPAPDVAPSFKPGLILAAAILIVYGSLAVSIDFHGSRTASTATKRPTT